MSEQNLDVVRRAVAALNAVEMDALPGLMHPDIEWRDRMHAPDVPEVLHGIGALEQLSSQWEAAYDSLTAEVLEYIDADPWVICVTRWRARSEGSGIEVDLRSVDAYEVEDGLITRSWGGFPDLQAARAALGMPAQ
jgi:ketosteroid isomerase-like protein